jgi:hypothetical protein
MPINGHDPSSQTLFSPRQSSLTHPYSMVNGHIVSSRAPALRAASAGPSAVRPDGLGDARVSFSQTPVVRPATPVDGERPRGGGWQDKGALGSAPQASPQPAPGTEGARRSLVDTARDRSQNRTDGLKRSARLTLRVYPGVKTALERIADDDGVSLSEASAKGLEVFARAKIHDQEEAMFEPRMQAMMRREIRASDNRHIYFEMRNAIAAEQTRILTTDLYKRQLVKEGVPLKEINKKLDDAYTMARTNVLRKTKSPQLKNLLSEWWRLTEDWTSDRQDQAEGREEEKADEGEGVTGTTQA